MAYSLYEFGISFSYRTLLTCSFLHFILLLLGQKTLLFLPVIVSLKWSSRGLLAITYISCFLYSTDLWPNALLFSWLHFPFLVSPLSSKFFYYKIQYLWTFCFLDPAFNFKILWPQELFWDSKKLGPGIVFLNKKWVPVT